MSRVSDRDLTPKCATAKVGMDCFSVLMAYRKGHICSFVASCFVRAGERSDGFGHAMAVSQTALGRLTR